MVILTLSTLVVLPVSTELSAHCCQLLSRSVGMPPLTSLLNLRVALVVVQTYSLMAAAVYSIWWVVSSRSEVVLNGHNVSRQPVGDVS
jgi:hypothetical protein